MSYQRKLQRGKLARKELKEPDYIESWQEWQEKQYIPGYYIGKNRKPHFYKEMLNNQPSGAVYFAFACFIFGLIIYRVFFTDSGFDDINDYITTVFTGGLGVLFVYIGIERSKMTNKKR